jgi:predicted pyridoxine 5'-phosphate oxidase superfamily flavin-nucleotide-binding protein
VPLSIPTLRRCFEGAIPATIATCSRDGTPNVSYVSEVHYVDRQHVALSFQFFSKTRQNVLENPRATVVVIHPDSGAQYKLAVRYLRTEESGPLFECMKAKLAGLASHAGMTGVFRLRGSDVYRVESVTEVYGTPLAAPPPPEVDVTTLRACMTRLSAASDLASLLDALLDVLGDPIGLDHAMVLMHDPAADRLYTVASRGYAQSGVGAEVRPGEGIIGAAAQARIPIRISHATSEFGYGRAMREAAERRGIAGLEHEIPFPGLPESQSQIAVPILAGQRLLGVLFAESAAPGRFGYDEEDGFMVLASHVGAVAALLEEEPASSARDEAHATRATVAPQGAPLRVRHYAENDSVFVDEEYLIKGVAGAILWRLLRAHVEDGRSDHTNRELRLDPSIRLPDLSENLEARLILLARRLEERCPSLRIEKTGRGRFRFHVLRPVTLAEIPR